MHHEKGTSTWRQATSGDPHIATASGIGVRVWRAALLLMAKAVDHGPDDGAIGFIECKQLKAGLIAGSFKVAIEKTIGEVTATMRLEIHACEGNFVDHVDPA